MSQTQEKRAKKRMWTEVDDIKFIQVWANYYEELRGPRKNALVYAEMIKELSTLGLEVVPEEVRNKVLNLTKKYRSQKRNYDPMCPFAVWPLYNSVDDIIGAEPVNQIEHNTSDNSRSSCKSIQYLKINNINKNNVSVSDTIEETKKPQFLTVKCGSPISDSLVEFEATSPPLSPALEDISYPPSPAEPDTTETPAEQGIDALITVCTRLSENVERHLLRSFVVEKQKLQELKAIRLATTKLSNGILELLKTTKKNNKYK